MARASLPSLFQASWLTHALVMEVPLYFPIFFLFSNQHSLCKLKSKILIYCKRLVYAVFAPCCEVGAAAVEINRVYVRLGLITLNHLRHQCYNSNTPISYQPTKYISIKTLLFGSHRPFYFSPFLGNPCGMWRRELIGTSCLELEYIYFPFAILSLYKLSFLLNLLIGLSFCSAAE